MIDTFIYWQGMAQLKCYQMEGALTADFWAGEAKLGKRLFDRQHATVALPYCDWLVTDDTDLAKRANAAKAMVKFATASVVGGAEFVAECKALLDAKP